MEDLKGHIENKRSDIEGNRQDLADLKTHLGELILECESLYNEYDEARIQVCLVLGNGSKQIIYLFI